MLRIPLTLQSKPRKGRDVRSRIWPQQVQILPPQPKITPSTQQVGGVLLLGFWVVCTGFAVVHICAKAGTRLGRRGRYLSPLRGIWVRKIRLMTSSPYFSRMRLINCGSFAMVRKALREADDLLKGASDEDAGLLREVKDFLFGLADRLDPG